MLSYVTIFTFYMKYVVKNQNITKKADVSFGHQPLQLSCVQEHLHCVYTHTYF